ncbi:MAG: valine--tRNA ligase [Pseudomonadota bacterium]
MLDQHYDPHAAEARIYPLWETAGCFKPSMDTSAEAYSIVIPPPNVTGVLHMGHALNNTLQDVLARYHRMRGKNVLWQPGADHAGIATQMVVERQLAESGANEDRRSLGREAFVERVWDWKAESGGKITEQLKRLGASCDWSREKFTMGEREDPDNQMVRAVRKVFVDLYNKGLIYRDKRLVNWDPHFQTAISDLEVEQREVDGHFWHLRYPLADGVTYEHPVFDEDGEPAGTETRDYLVVATTRPETMLGDTGVAVHPDDERYKDLVGKFVDLPIVNRRIPIVADEHADPEKGSGAVKITPAHDFNDFQVGERCDLPKLNILTDTASIVGGQDERGAPIADGAAEAAQIPQELRGLDRYEARDKIVAKFEALGLLQEIESKKIEQPFGDRSGVVIEPYLTDQWYVDAESMAKPAMAAVREGKTRFVPETWEKTYFNWMDNIQPWCVSRQLWWGHRIPVWYGPEVRQRDDGAVDILDPRGKIFVGENFDVVARLAQEYYGAPAVQVGTAFEQETLLFSDENDASKAPDWAKGADMRPKKYPLIQDPDVLDTWFSSALWPFSTQGWPENTEALQTFYPTATLVTAFDIIFFWVARMMMMGIEFMDGEVPFKDVYIHALVLDEKGQKMSKSKGNAMDPLELVDEYGADALRFTMAAMAAQGRNIRLSKQRVEGYRNFGTKLWNAARFCQMNECVSPAEDVDPAALNETVNKWILGELAKTAAEVARGIEDYRFNEAAGAAYRFIWNVFCDWYLELIKPLLNGEDEAAKAETRAVAAWTLDQTLKLLHPFMPFLTEELWEKLAEFGPERPGFLMLQAWPDFGPEWTDAAASAEIDWVIRLITEVRGVRGDLNVPPGAKPVLTLANASDEAQGRARRHDGVLTRLARLDRIEIANVAPDGTVNAVLDEATLCLDIAGLIDLDAERARLDKEIGKLEGDIAGIDKKLSNEKFVARAPAEVVQEQHTRKADAEAVVEKLKASRQRLLELG